MGPNTFDGALERIANDVMFDSQTEIFVVNFRSGLNDDGEVDTTSDTATDAFFRESVVSFPANDHYFTPSSPDEFNTVMTQLGALLRDR